MVYLCTCGFFTQTIRMTELLINSEQWQLVLDYCLTFTEMYGFEEWLNTHAESKRFHVTNTLLQRVKTYLKEKFKWTDENFWNLLQTHDAILGGDIPLFVALGCPTDWHPELTIYAPHSRSKPLRYALDHIYGNTLTGWIEPKHHGGFEDHSELGVIAIRNEMMNGWGFALQIIAIDPEWQPLHSHSHKRQRTAPRLREPLLVERWLGHHSTFEFTSASTNGQTMTIPHPLAWADRSGRYRLSPAGDRCDLLPVDTVDRALLHIRCLLYEKRGLHVENYSYDIIKARGFLIVTCARWVEKHDLLHRLFIYEIRDHSITIKNHIPEEHRYVSLTLTIADRIREERNHISWIVD